MSIGGLTGQADPAARTQARREARIRVAHRAGWDELERRHLTFGRFGVVVHEPSGDRFRINRGEVNVDSKNIAAYYVDPAGDAAFLERLGDTR